jgi:hypothetical protein
MRRIRHVRLPQANKQKFYYANWYEKSTEYQTDEDGNVKYVLVNGRERPIEKVVPAHFSQPVEFEASINMGGRNAESVEYGIDVSGYSAILTTPKGLFDITETSIIWHTSEPKLKDGYADETTCDYHVVKKTSSLIYDRYVLAKRVK